MKLPQKENLIKISDYIWEIPKNFREDMKVPARVFASEKMLNDLFKDRSLWQLVNMATLPGAYKYALAMPDIHEGYGFCLTKDARISTSLGYFIKIKDLENKNKFENIKILTFDKKSKRLITTKIDKFFKLKPYTKILRITTEAGLTLSVTSDHQIYTRSGIKKAYELTSDDEIIVYGLESVSYKEPPNEIIVDEGDVLRVLKSSGLPNIKTIYKTIVKKLKIRKILPLAYNNPKLPYLIKIAAFVFGDGTMNFIGKKKDGVIHFYGKKEDFIKLKEDLKILGYNSSKIYPQKSKFYSVDVNASSLVVLLEALGVPRGRKVNKKYRIPKWLFKAPLWQKRLFLATLFGCELRTPHRRKERKFGFNAPVFSMNKNINLIENGKQFLKDIAKLCQEFGVKTTEIDQRREIISKDGNRTVCLELIFSSETESLINLWSKIGFEYNRKKLAKASVYSIYLRLKKKNLEKRSELKISILELLKNSLSYIKIAERLNNGFFTKRFITDYAYRLKNGLEYKKPKVPNRFITLKEFLKTKKLGNDGFCFDKIEKIEEIKYADFVYDFRVNNINHNFIANNFVVSNCVGGILATLKEEGGHISPGGVGFDINCGIRLLVSQLSFEEIRDKISKLTEEIYKEVPSGVGEGGFWKLNKDEMNKVLAEGAKWLYKIGYAEKEDLESTESYGKLEGADPNVVSKAAKERGRDQLGTIGAGNHFVEIQKITEVFNEKIAKKLDLEKNKICVMIHCGSRGLGHQVATDYIKEALRYLDKKNIDLVDRELAYFPFESEQGKNYLSAMNAAANFAFANRQLIVYEIRKAFKKIFGKDIHLKQIYDVAHNIIKEEIYDNKKLLIHRKGATRSFPAGHKELPEKYKEIGQPTLIPGSMGTSSYVLIGKPLAMKISFGSSPHGAGRMMSRAEAKRKIKGSELKKQLENKGISISAGSMSGLAEEAPEAYKNVSEVVEVVHQIGISEKIVKLVPVGVIKG